MNSIEVVEFDGDVLDSIEMVDRLTEASLSPGRASTSNQRPANVFENTIEPGIRS